MQAKHSKFKVVRSLAEIAQDQPPSRFLDYKDFLENLRVVAKRERGRFTFHELSEELGLSSSNAAYMIAKGLRPFSSSVFQAVTKALKIGGYERKYLRVLIEYSASKNDQQSSQAFSEMIRIKEKIVGTKEGSLSLKFYSDWRHAAIFEMVGLPGFRENMEDIADALYHKTRPEQVRSSLSLLESLGFITRDEAGTLRKSTQQISTPKEVEGLAVVGFHHAMLELSKSSLSQVPASDRNVTALTLSVSEKTFDRMRDDIGLFREYLKFLAEKDPEPGERVVQVNLQAFALTRPDSK